MRLLGLVYGRRLGNTEILVKEALMGAEEVAPVDVELIRLNDLNIKPCTGCDWCVLSIPKLGHSECSIKDDDMAWLMDQVFQADGVIIGAPVYFLGPPGPYKAICDRMIPYSSKALKIVKENISAGKDVRKAGGIISVGGGSHHWSAMGASLIQRLASPLMMPIVDKLNLVATPGKGQALLNEAALASAHKIGRNVAQSMGKVASEMEYFGDEPGICPICHCNLVYPGRRFQAECAICGAGGTLKTENGTFTLELDEKSLPECHLTVEGRDLHLREIREYKERFKAHIDDVNRATEKYHAYKFFTRPGEGK